MVIRPRAAHEARRGDNRLNGSALRYVSVVAVNRSAMSAASGRITHTAKHSQVQAEMQVHDVKHTLQVDGFNVCSQK